MGSAALDALRARIRAIEGGTVVRRRRAPTGVEVFDTLLGGLPEPGIVELSGAEGTGRFRVAFALASAYGRMQRRVAWIDPQSRLYPPAAADHGVDLASLLVVCPSEDGTAPWGWATEQILRSGCFPLVVVDLPEPAAGEGRRPMAHGWARAVEHGRCTALVLTRKPARELAADVRLTVGGERLVVVRDRTGMAGGEGAMPPWPKGASPWGP
jgi:hypothetical protein